MTQKKYDEAIVKLDGLAASRPREPQARFLKGVALTDQKRLMRRLDVYRALITDFPEMPEPAQQSRGAVRAKGRAGAGAGRARCWQSGGDPITPSRTRTSATSMRSLRPSSTSRGLRSRQERTRRRRPSSSSSVTPSRHRHRIPFRILRSAIRIPRRNPFMIPTSARCRRGQSCCTGRARVGRQSASRPRHDRRKDPARALSGRRAEDRRELPRLRRRPSTTTARNSIA